MPYQHPHQVHHSPSRIEVMTSFYKHPVEIAADSVLIGFLIYCVFGGTAEAGAWTSLFGAAGEYFYHANIRTPAWIGWFVQRPEHHSIHHQRDVHTHNFGDVTARSDRKAEHPMSGPSWLRLHWRRWAAAVVVVGLMGWLLSRSALQTALIYPATRYSHATFENIVDERFGPHTLVLAPFDAIVVEPDAPAVATAIWFHGNGNVNIDFAGLAPIFRARHVRLTLAEYPGYGAREGTPSERALVGDAQALYAAVAARYPWQPIIVIGQSLGSGVAAQVSAEMSQPAPSRLVLATPFFDLPDAASHALWNLPVRSLVRDRYDSAGALVRYAGAVIVVVAAKDSLVGAEGGRRLTRLVRPAGTTTLIELPEADHNDWLGEVSPALWDALLALPRQR